MAILMCSSEEKDLFSSSTPRATIDPTRKHRISEDYVGASKEEIRKVVKIQEELDIDVLVHVEPEVGPGVACTREFLSWDLVVVVVVSSNGGAPPCFWHRRDGGVVARHVRVGSNDCLLGCHYLGRVLDLQLLRSLILWRARRVIDEAAWSKLVAWISCG